MAVQWVCVKKQFRRRVAGMARCLCGCPAVCDLASSIPHARKDRNPIIQIVVRQMRLRPPRHARPMSGVRDDSADKRDYFKLNYQPQSRFGRLGIC
jgi:hypothetical protein